MEQLRIVLLGKSGVGKSSTGNTLLGKKPFHTEPSSQGVTQACTMSTSTVDGYKICVVDTPGWTDLSLTKAETIQEIVKCIDISEPGPHVLLLLLPIGCFTKQEIDTAKQILEVFGEKAKKYTMVLFTKGDDLEEKTIEEYLDGIHPDLRKVIEICEGRFHVINNNDKENHMQVSTLLEKIKNMVKMNKGEYYTKAMFQKMMDQMDEKRKMRKIITRVVEDECKAQIKDLAVESNDGTLERESEETKHHAHMEGRDSARTKERGHKASLQKGQGENDRMMNERMTMNLNQDTMVCYKNELDENDSKKYVVHTSKFYGKKCHGEKQHNKNDANHGTKSDNHSKELKQQKREAELQRLVEKTKMTWQKEKDILEKEIRQLREKQMEQKNELESVKRELQQQEYKIDAFEKLREEGQQQREELERLRRENEEEKDMIKHRSIALQQNFDKFERALDTNTDIKASLKQFTSQLQKLHLHSK